MADVAADADPGAFFRAHYPDLYRFVSARSGLPRTDVEDLTQETLVQAWRDRERFRKEASPKTWLLGIARNRIQDFLRKARVRREGDRVVQALARLDSEELPGDVLESADLGARVRRALHELPAEYAELLMLRYLQGRSVRSIAEAASESQDAVESRLRRAREAFRKQLAEGEPDDERTES